MDAVESAAVPPVRDAAGDRGRPPLIGRGPAEAQSIPDADPHDLGRFVDAQAGVYPQALAELKRGRKASHWMWFVFPQIAGLGQSAMARRYAIADVAEARAYLAHPVLGSRLVEATGAVSAAPGASAEDIMGSIDAIKLRSSLTLFAAVAPDPAPFEAALDRFFGGERDPETMRRL